MVYLHIFIYISEPHLKFFDSIDQNWLLFSLFSLFSFFISIDNYNFPDLLFSFQFIKKLISENSLTFLLKSKDQIILRRMIKATSLWTIINGINKSRGAKQNDWKFAFSWSLNKERGKKLLCDECIGRWNSIEKKYAKAISQLLALQFLTEENFLFVNPKGSAKRLYHPVREERW